MTSDFGDRSVDKLNFKPKKITSENWTKFRELQMEMAQEILKSTGGKLETHKILILVDLQGMYLGLHRWLSELNFPIEGGLILSRLAFFQIHDAFERIKTQTLKTFDSPVMDIENLLEQIEQSGSGGSITINHESTYLNFIPEFELFYAPAPLLDIEKRLQYLARSGKPEVQSQLNKIREGIVKHHFFERNYAAYDDFVSKLKANPEYSASEKGFFNFYVGSNGLKVFDEKEVDTRIVMRAMDAFYNYGTDSLCIVSSDQDFMPVHSRASEFGIQSYQADLAKFKPEDNVGRKIKALGAGFLQGEIKPEWPLKLIVEASSSSNFEHQPLYKLTENEFTAICEMHNNMNEFHLSPIFLPDGSTKLEISKPVKLPEN